MKLRNKKTGEMGDLIIDKALLVVRTGTAWLHYTSLAELNAEWEDMPEEPKGFWSINGDVSIEYFDRLNNNDHCKQIGNYFETKEEAEKVVEKLKAWRRLKDKKFKFRKWRTADIGGDKYYFVIQAEADDADKGDLDMLFGGEE